MIPPDGKERLSRRVQTGRGGAIPGYRGRDDHTDRRETRHQRGDALGVVRGRRGAIRHRKPAAGGEPPAGVETPEQELARLRAENKALRAAEARLSTERDILRSAAKYFAGETNW